MRRLAILSFAAVLPALALAAPPQMKEGLWEVTTKVEMPGMPASVPPQVMQQCITKKDLQNPRNTTPGGGMPGGNCQVTDYRMEGNSASWKVACTGQGAMTGTGSMTFGGDTYTGMSRMTMNHGGQAQTITMRYSGRHIGPCRK